MPIRKDDTKTILSVYIDRDLIEAIDELASEESRRLSAGSIQVRVSRSMMAAHMIAMAVADSQK